MIKIENVVLPSDEQWLAVIRGMRNPLNSWKMSDTKTVFDPWEEEKEVIFGEKDLDLMERLRNSGASHRKFMRMIPVYVDITAPLYWWKEFDTYKVGTVANSCSTMHKIQAKKFTMDDFSTEHLDEMSLGVVESIIHVLNANRGLFRQTKDKKYWWQMIQLLPSSYNQKRTVLLNYEVLGNMYHDRKDHKLDEWRETWCEWIKGLPLSELITGESFKEENNG